MFLLLPLPGPVGVGLAFPLAGSVLAGPPLALPSRGAGGSPRLFLPPPRFLFFGRVPTLVDRWVIGFVLR